MFDVTSIIESGGLLILTLIVFAESGMMVGFFLPGDTLLLSAGILAASGALPIGWVLFLVSAAAIIGDNVGYQIGKTMGPRLFKKDGLIFRHEYIMQAEKFYAKYGTKTMLVAHFIPIVRTFAPVTAGAAKMDRKQFIIYDAIGDITWAFSVTLLGYFVASRIPGIEHYIEPILLIIIVGFLAPTVYHVLKDPRMRQAIKNKLKRTPRSKE